MTRWAAARWEYTGGELGAELLSVMVLRNRRADAAVTGERVLFLTTFSMLYPTPYLKARGRAYRRMSP